MYSHTFRLLALFSAFTLGLSGPAYALRNPTTEGAGLEESITDALSTPDDGDSDSTPRTAEPVVQRRGDQPQTSMTDPVVSATAATGLEDRPAAATVLVQPGPGPSGGGARNPVLALPLSSLEEQAAQAAPEIGSAGTSAPLFQPGTTVRLPVFLNTDNFNPPEPVYGMEHQDGRWTLTVAPNINPSDLSSIDYDVTERTVTVQADGRTVTFSADNQPVEFGQTLTGTAQIVQTAFVQFTQVPGLTPDRRARDEADIRSFLAVLGSANPSAEGRVAPVQPAQSGSLPRGQGAISAGVTVAPVPGEPIITPIGNNASTRIEDPTGESVQVAFVPRIASSAGGSPSVSETTTTINFKTGDVIVGKSLSDFTETTRTLSPGEPEYAAAIREVVELVGRSRSDLLQQTRTAEATQAANLRGRLERFYAERVPGGPALAPAVTAQTVSAGTSAPSTGTVLDSVERISPARVPPALPKNVFSTQTLEESAGSSAAITGAQAASISQTLAVSDFVLIVPWTAPSVSRLASSAASGEASTAALAGAVGAGVSTNAAVPGTAAADALVTPGLPPANVTPTPGNATTLATLPDTLDRTVRQGNPVSVASAGTASPGVVVSNAGVGVSAPDSAITVASAAVPSPDASVIGTADSTLPQAELGSATAAVPAEIRELASLLPQLSLDQAAQPTKGHVFLGNTALVSLFLLGTELSPNIAVVDPQTHAQLLQIAELAGSSPSVVEHWDRTYLRVYTYDPSDPLGKELALETAAAGAEEEVASRLAGVSGAFAIRPVRINSLSELRDEFGRDILALLNAFGFSYKSSEILKRVIDVLYTLSHL